MTQLSHAQELHLFLHNVLKKSKTAKAWVENLITPELYMMMFIQAEREGDWPFQI